MQATTSRGYSKHLYDVDAVDLYTTYDKLWSHNATKLVIDVNDALENIMESIKIFCEIERIDFSDRFTENKQRFPLVIPSTSNSYPYFFSLFLATCDIPKINSILNYQNGHYVDVQVF